MRAIRKINNNVVVCTDDAGRELVAMGKGVGFGVFPRDIPLKDIERTFYDVSGSYLAAIDRLPSDVLDFAVKIVDIAKNELPYELNPALSFVLADHIAFALERKQRGINVKMPLSYDVRQSFPQEYRIGLYAVHRLKLEKDIELPEEEAASIALNIVNARLSPESMDERGRADQDARMLEELTQIIEDRFGTIVDRTSFSYSRYATHMMYLFDRIHAHESLDSAGIGALSSFNQQFPEGVACVNAIADHIREVWGAELSEEERLYIILHVSRLCKS